MKKTLVLLAVGLVCSVATTAFCDDTNVFARFNVRAALANKDGPGSDALAGEGFDTQALSV